MTKREEFLVWIDELIKNQKDDSTVPMNDSVKAYLDAIRDDSVSDSDKPQFTENGKAILMQLQSMPDGMYKAKDIAEGMGIASKSVAGAIRKLVTEGYCEKIGKDPVVYSITEKGKNVNFEEN